MAAAGSAASRVDTPRDLGIDVRAVALLQRLLERKHVLVAELDFLNARLRDGGPNGRTDAAFRQHYAWVLLQVRAADEAIEPIREEIERSIPDGEIADMLRSDFADAGPSSSSPSLAAAAMAAGSAAPCRTVGGRSALSTTSSASLSSTSSSSKSNSSSLPCGSMSPSNGGAASPAAASGAASPGPGKKRRAPARTVSLQTQAVARAAAWTPALGDACRNAARLMVEALRGKLLENYQRDVLGLQLIDLSPSPRCKSEKSSPGSGERATGRSPVLMSDDVPPLGEDLVQPRPAQARPVEDATVAPPANSRPTLSSPGGSTRTGGDADDGDNVRDDDKVGGDKVGDVDNKVGDVDNKVGDVDNKVGDVNNKVDDDNIVPPAAARRSDSGATTAMMDIDDAVPQTSPRGGASADERFSSEAKRMTDLVGDCVSVLLHIQARSERAIDPVAFRTQLDSAIDALAPSNNASLAVHRNILEFIREIKASALLD
jgi:hypothetical protein